jgi:DNA-binding transcriptional LysR family regulator
MKIHLLRYFIVLAEELHYGRAAAKLSITQPPLSVAIKALEDSLGVRLFERSAKQVQLTEAGAAFLVEARRALGQLQHAADVAREVAEGRRGHLAIGVTASMIYREVPRVLGAFTRQRPDIEVTLHEMSTIEQQQAVARGQLHGGFVNVVTPAPGLAHCPIAPDPLMCCLPEAHPLARGPEVDLRALAHERFVMFEREASPAHHDDVIACLRAAGIHPRIHHAVRQWFSVIALVGMGQGVALVPACMQVAGMNGVRFLPLKTDGGRPALTAGAFVWDARQTSASLQAFVDAVKDSPGGG